MYLHLYKFNIIKQAAIGCFRVPKILKGAQGCLKIMNTPPNGCPGCLNLGICISYSLYMKKKYILRILFFPNCRHLRHPFASLFIYFRHPNNIFGTLLPPCSFISGTLLGTPKYFWHPFFILGTLYFFILYFSYIISYNIIYSLARLI